MDMRQLEALGFICVGGKIDRLGKNYGFLTASGPVLTPAGQAIVDNTLSGDDLVVDKTPKRPGRKPSVPVDPEFLLED